MGGLAFPIANAAAIVGTGVIRVYASQNAQQLTSSGPYVPPQWARPALTMITVPPAYNVPTLSDGVNTITAHAATGTALGQSGTTDPTTGAYTLKTGTIAQTAKPTYLVFDGVLRLGHSQRAVPTRLPIQDGSNLTDHVMLEPATLTLGILMTDVLPAFGPGMWTGNASKSVACFQTLDALRALRVPLTITTRLKTYTNMVLIDVPAEDTVQTRWGLRTPVIFEQIFLAQVATQGVSARTQTTDDTSLGTTQPVAVPAGVTAQNGLPSITTGAASSSALQAQGGYVQGAGNWSSNSGASIGGGS
jgi:hypothetical protein